MMINALLQKTCLKSSYLLRKQLFLSYGIISLVTLTITVSVACFCSLYAGETVKSRSTKLQQEQAMKRLMNNSQSVADTLTSYMENLEGTVQIISEIVQDRIVGYPYEGWEEDEFVPFRDMDTGRNIYPLKSPPLPLDWEIISNIYNGTDGYDKNAASFEHLQERQEWLSYFPNASTASCAYFVQGSCDPNETNVNSATYHPNCTIHNNDMKVGGAIQPTIVNRGLYEKAADLTVFFKPLFEIHKDILVIGMYFHNQGAGSYVQYPANHQDGTRPPYTSLGCEWMRNLNPYTGKPFGTEDDIARCHPQGALVSQREYNANERGWCQHFALNPGKTNWYGPFWTNDWLVPIVMVGRSVFDRISNEFIGCIGVSIALEDFYELLHESKVKSETNLTELSVVRFGDGTIFGDTANSMKAPSEQNTKVTETDFISAETFENVKKCVKRNAFGESTEECFIHCQTGDAMYTGHALMLAPDDREVEATQFLLIQSMPLDLMRVNTKTNKHIDDEVLEICVLSILLGFAAIVFVFIIVWVTSRVLTEPLLWMEQVAGDIVKSNSYETNERKGFSTWQDNKQQHNQIPKVSCKPSTEIAELVSAFHVMIHGFSGKGAPLVAEADLHEIRNTLTWQSDFQQLYSNSTEHLVRVHSAVALNPIEGEAEKTGPKKDAPQTCAASKPSEEPTTQRSTAFESGDRIGEEAGKQQQQTERPKINSIVPAPSKLNLNRNILISTRDLNCKKSFEDRFNNNPQMHSIRSSLFWWILLLIVVPLLLVNAGICTIVSKRIHSIIPSWIHSVEKVSLELERASVRSLTSSKASGAEMSVQRSIRDLYLMTRVAGWLYFDGIIRSGSFTFMTEATEECKVYPDLTCPYLDSAHQSCACEWHDLSQNECQKFENNTRPFQHRFYRAEKRDYHPMTGNRPYVIEKKYDSPENTVWWNDVNELPGSKAGWNASGYDTIYSRLRVASAMSTVEIPLYRECMGSFREKQFLSSFIALDADGLSTGYMGCSQQYALASQFQSSETNRAAEVAPDLCPLEKYGFDPRCREWYYLGKMSFEKKGIPVHFSAPYKFGMIDNVASSISSVIANPKTGEFVGAAMIDFYPSSVRELFQHVQQVSFVITPESDLKVDDTVVGLNKTEKWKPARILDLLFQYDDKDNSTHRSHFLVEIMPKLKNGGSGEEVFRRMNRYGMTEELTLVYRPVRGRVLIPLDPSDFSRGVNVSSIHVYTVGIAYREELIRAPWEGVHEGIRKDLDRLYKIYLCSVVIVSGLFLLFTCSNTVSVTRPLLTLLNVVQTINTGQTENGIPPLHGGSREVLQVYNSFTKLYKIIRVSNVAFFSGNLVWAYEFVSDALNLFQKVGDEKAVGVACSNLGNTLHAMDHDELNPMRRSEQMNPKRKCESIASLDITKTALDHYNEAIRIATLQLEQADSDIAKAEFAQTLADRLFNRALFQLFSAAKGKLPTEEKVAALENIRRVKNVDTEVKQFWANNNLILKNSNGLFFRLLQRTIGLLEYFDDTEDVWDADEVMREADKLLFSLWNEPSAPLFDEISRVGRLQQLESVAIQLELKKKKKMEASRLAIRMFVEDEYLIENAFKWGSTALLAISQDAKAWPNPRASMIKSILESDLRKMLRSCKQVSLDIGKNIVFAFEINEVWEGSELLKLINQNCLRLYDGGCLKDDYMGVVAYTTKGDLNVPLGIKCENEELQRHTLDLATTSTSERACSAFPYATQILVDCTASAATDSFILLITDGFSWDSLILNSIRQQLQNLNSERFTTVHVIILGIEIEEKEIVEECKSMCTMSNMSMYMDLTLDIVDYAFESIKTLVCGGDISSVYNQGIMMERF